MLRRMLMLAMTLAMLVTLLMAPATAAPQPVGRVEKGGVTYTVYEERKPGDPNLYRYYVEDGALGGGSSYRFSPRGSGMESAAFIAATMLFVASVFAVYRRLSLLRLLERSTAHRTA